MFLYLQLDIGSLSFSLLQWINCLSLATIKFNCMSLDIGPLSFSLPPWIIDLSLQTNSTVWHLALGPHRPVYHPGSTTLVWRQLNSTVWHLTLGPYRSVCHPGATASVWQQLVCRHRRDRRICHTSQCHFPFPDNLPGLFAWPRGNSQETQLIFMFSSCSWLYILEPPCLPIKNICKIYIFNLLRP